MADCSELQSFVIARHNRYGYLLLRSREKGGYKLPGGLVDSNEAKYLGLENATVVAAVRDLLQATGMDLTSETHRLHRIRFPAGVQSKLGMNYNFYELQLRDDDSLHLKGDLRGLTQPKTGQSDFYLRLSDENKGFYFEPDRQKAASALKRQSNGKPSKALRATQAVYSPDNCCLVCLWRYFFGS
mmetsp:Transcript_1762/g.3168  ORF Transcript_1762/g.3168 Transcript_1762/m.3168 type:complete len:185 (-) Transcript_1762:305-859(-)